MSRRLLAVLTFLLIPSGVFACLWDSDTIMMERQRFPDALELITGKFLRHSKEFYQWRIDDRLEKLKSAPDNLSYYDDLAVAYDKTGQQQKAIETILAKDKIQPGLYETEANLGTFYIHSGEYEKGLVHIDKALHINPDAHFGREKYQKLLVEYMLGRRKDGRKGLPLVVFDSDIELPFRHSFTEFLEDLNHDRKDRSLTEPERQAAIKGILGIMKFGNYESPMVLEALASLLSRGLYDRRDKDAKQLAARAYLKASYVVPDESAKQAYRKLADRVLDMQASDGENQMRLEDPEATFKKELSEADKWYALVRQDELTWIEAGKNPEVEFTRKYYEPAVSNLAGFPWRAFLVPGFIATALLVLGLVAWRAWRRPPSLVKSLE